MNEVLSSISTMSINAVKILGIVFHLNVLEYELVIVLPCVGCFIFGTNTTWPSGQTLAFKLCGHGLDSHPGGQCV